MNKREFLKGGAMAAAAVATKGFAVDKLGAKKDAQGVPRTNWSENLHYHTDHVLQPATVAEMQDAVRSVKHARALGTRHSFSTIADSTDTQISTLKLKDVQLNAAAKTVRVGAGIRYGDLAVQIDKAGWAVHNLASLPHISVAGAVATATHGSGLHNGNLATQVTEIEMVKADGSVATLSRAKDGDKFAAAVVGLGALGMVTHLTLEVQPRFDVAQVVYQNLPFSELEHHFMDIMSAGYSVSMFTDWQKGVVGELWVKRRVDQGGASAPPPMFYGAKLATKKLHPVLGLPAEACSEQGNIPGPWYERLPHFKMAFTPSAGHEIQTEYFVPIEHAYEAIRAVESLRDKITPHLFVAELRTVAADDLWMSMAYKRQSISFHFTWKPEMEPLTTLLPQIEAKLAPFAPRPHWAKVNTMDAKTLAANFPRLNDFKALMKEMDPQGKFVNAYLREKLGV